ncbi:hypothetical protein BJX70DRAFT_396295 [Aspergillus crustosus]
MFPPVDETAKRLVTLDLTREYFHNLILPKSGGKEGNYREFMTELGNNILKAKPAFDPSNSADKELLGNLDNSLKGIIETRQSNYDEFFITELKKCATAAKLGIRFETINYMRGGESFPAFDLENTLRAYSSNLVIHCDQMHCDQIQPPVDHI